MKLRLRATECHLPYGITHCYLPLVTSEHTRLNPSQRSILDLPTPEGWKVELMILPHGDGVLCTCKLTPLYLFVNAQ